MKKAREQLAEYRKRKPQLSKIHMDNHQDGPEASQATNNQNPSANHKVNVLDTFITLDVLDIYPLRKWRAFCAASPLQCWMITISLWIAGQLLAAKAEFGFVYFVLSMLLILLLNLGERRRGELSAYSVFNPNYERLPGQLTEENFTRDLLMVKR